MDNEALKVFRVRSRYYSVLDESGNGFPSGVGKQFIAQIPSDPAAFQVWKCDKIEFFRAEQDRLDDLHQRSPSPDEHRNYWGYSEKPSISEPYISGPDAWMYIIDLDTDTLIVKVFHIASRTFRLNMIPVSMFAQVSDPAQLMVVPISECHMPTSYTYDSKYVAVYNRTQPTLHDFTYPAHQSNLVPTQLRRILMQNFLRHYYELIVHANDDTQANAYSFRQLLYGLLNLCDHSTRLVFEHVPDSTSYQCLNESGRFTVPSWEFPASSEYILRSVIIVLEPRMAILEFLQAAIGRAISMAETRPGCRNALIVSIDSIVVVTFTRNADDDLSVSYTDTLLFCAYMAYCSSNDTPSRGMTAATAVFASNTHEARRPAPPGLPAELWQEVFLQSTASSQDALSRTCRFFSGISDRFPRFDRWTLERQWRVDVAGFFAAGDDKDCLLRLSACEWNDTDRGYQAVLWVGGQRVRLGVPLFVVHVDYEDWICPAV